MHAFWPGLLVAAARSASPSVAGTVADAPRRAVRGLKHAALAYMRALGAPRDGMGWESVREPGPVATPAFR